MISLEKKIAEGHWEQLTDKISIVQWMNNIAHVPNGYLLKVSPHLWEKHKLVIFFIGVILYNSIWTVWKWLENSKFGGKHNFKNIFN